MSAKIIKRHKYSELAAEWSILGDGVDLLRCQFPRRTDSIVAILFVTLLDSDLTAQVQA